MPQSLACQHVHLVFSTKNRQPLITPDLPRGFTATSAVSPAALIRCSFRSVVSPTTLTFVSSLRVNSATRASSSANRLRWSRQPGHSGSSMRRIVVRQGSKLPLTATGR